MATVWWWVVKPAEAGASVRPADAKLISTPGSGAEYSALIGNGAYQGQQRFQGPFTTQAAAKAAPAGGESTAQQIAAGIEAGNAAAGATGLPSVPGVGTNPLAGLAAIGDFFSRLTQANTWIRVGKILVGGALVLIGLAHITGASGAAASYARKIPVPI
jgi:hypothetical protein